MIKCKYCDFVAEHLSDLRHHFVVTHHNDVNADMVRRHEASSDIELHNAGYAAGLIALLSDPLHKDSREALQEEAEKSFVGAGGASGGAGASGTFDTEPPPEIVPPLEGEVAGVPEPNDVPETTVEEERTDNGYCDSNDSSSSSNDSSSGSDN